MNYGRTSGTFTTNGAIRNSRIADAVGPSMLRDPTNPNSAVCVKTPGDLSTIVPGCVPLNLLGGPNNGSINPSQIDYLGFEGTSRAFDELFTVDATVTGDLVNIGGDRPASLAVGYQFRRQSGEQIADPIAASGDSADFNFKSTSGHFTANEAFAELSLPLLANMPAVQTLEASVAGRFVHYSTFGDQVTYKFGARWRPSGTDTQPVIRTQGGSGVRWRSWFPSGPRTGRIELIMPHDAGERIAADCAYLKHLTPIGFLTEGDFSEYKDQEIQPESDLANPFAYWLNQKIDFHRARGELDGHEARSVIAELEGLTA